MKLGIINSAFAQSGVDTASGLKHIARIGFDTVDIATEAVGISKKEVSLVANTCARHKLPIVSLALAATGLVDFNAAVRAFHVDRCKKFIDLARLWQAQHPAGAGRIHLAARSDSARGPMELGAGNLPDPG